MLSRFRFHIAHVHARGRSRMLINGNASVAGELKIREVKIRPTEGWLKFRFYFIREREREAQQESAVELQEERGDEEGRGVNRER